MSLVDAVEGILIGTTPDAALIKVGGLVLKVFTPTSDLQFLPKTGSEIRLVTKLIVREDDLQLYGFSSERGRYMFESLIGVSQVGPKAALAILTVLPPDELSAAVLSDDASAISRAQGVGKRTAERVILELRSRFEETEALAAIPVAGLGQRPNSTADPALQWLLGLGFSAIEARQALAVESEPDLDTDERVRRALQRIGRPSA